MDLIDFSKMAVSTEVEVREIAGFPHELIVKKTISAIDETCEKFISASPLVFISTCDSEGKCDVSLRGDSGSCVKILNERQLIIPDRAGNRKLDSILNILSNPNIGLLFVVPGIEEVLRVNGKAAVIKDKEILMQMELNGKAPLLGIGIDVEEVFVHCPRAMKESGIWNSQNWSDKEDIPTILEIFHAHLKMNGVDVSAL